MIKLQEINQKSSKKMAQGIYFCSLPKTQQKNFTNDKNRLVSEGAGGDVFVVFCFVVCAFCPKKEIGLSFVKDKQGKHRKQEQKKERHDIYLKFEKLLPGNSP